MLDVITNKMSSLYFKSNATQKKFFRKEKNYFPTKQKIII